MPMLDSLNRLLHHHLPPEERLLRTWTQRHGAVLKRVRDGTGYVVVSEGRRMEWGPPQRHYLQHTELRMRIETKMPHNTEMLVLTTSLAEQLERQAYERLVQGQQTEMTLELPEEMRWLACMRQVSLESVPALKGHFIAIGSVPAQVQNWLEGELALRLQRAVEGWLGRSGPLVLMLLRGRLYLRTEAHMLDEALLDGMRTLADAALFRLEHPDLQRQATATRIATNELDALEVSSATMPLDWPPRE
ncbi:MAG: hypothetical protein RJA44_2166 [Pseudomonadota bacterium]